MHSPNDSTPKSPHEDAAAAPAPDGVAPDRRTVLSQLSSAAMGVGLLASYGTFGAYALRFLYPASAPATDWRFVATIVDWANGEAKQWRAPDGRTLTIVRQGTGGTPNDFIALSDICPHLGCRVHWESQNNRFFCPCHNGAFDAAGKGIAGPPAEAQQSLPTYPLRLESGRLFIGVEASARAAPPDRTQPTRDVGTAQGSSSC